MGRDKAALDGSVIFGRSNRGATFVAHKECRALRLLALVGSKEVVNFNLLGQLGVPFLKLFEAARRPAILSAGFMDPLARTQDVNLVPRKIARQRPHNACLRQRDEIAPDTRRHALGHKVEIQINSAFCDTVSFPRLGTRAYGIARWS